MISSSKDAKMETTLAVQVRSVYGQDRIYPMNDQSKKICDLLGRKTLTKEDLVKLRGLGFEIFWVAIQISA